MKNLLKVISSKLAKRSGVKDFNTENSKKLENYLMDQYKNKI